ncbi:MAG TPA: hypothetical protein VGP70_06390 [Actinomadura sp.]|nr:hypothetical protein [Actinomadura sp.]
MTLLTTLAHLQAAESGRAQRLSTVRHHHLVDRPLVIVPLTLAGEAAAPLAAMVGTDRRDPALLVVPQPRDRELRFGFFAELARIVLPYIEARQAETETVPAVRGREERLRHADAPQVLVPNRNGIGYLRLLGRSTRFGRTDGPHPVDASVPLLGRWLTFLVERAEYPGAAVLAAVTELLAAQWATGQSAREDANLAALMGWIDPPAGMTGTQAALIAEDPLRCPPAGPATDPGFDRVILQPAIDKYDRACASDSTVARERALASLSEALEKQLTPTWELMWRGIDLLRALPEAPGAVTRWAEDRQRFTAFSTYLTEGGAPQPRRDQAVSAASRLYRMERAQAAFDAQRALDDPFVLAELRTTGEAFGGTVVAREPTRTVPGAKGRTTLRPGFTVRTDDPLRIGPGKPLVRPGRPKDKAQIRQITHDGTDDGDARLVVLEVTGGMGTPNKPTAEAVPQVGEEVRYIIDPGYWSHREFPSVEETPWTHGGPPEDMPAGDDDDFEE